MEQKYSKKQLEELYHCNIFKDYAGFDGGHLSWCAKGLPVGDKEPPLFNFACAWNLDELHEDIRECISSNFVRIK